MHRNQRLILAFALVLGSGLAQAYDAAQFSRLVRDGHADDALALIDIPVNQRTTIDYWRMARAYYAQGKCDSAQDAIDRGSVSPAGTGMVNLPDDFDALKMACRNGLAAAPLEANTAPPLTVHAPVVPVAASVAAMPTLARGAPTSANRVLSPLFVKAPVQTQDSWSVDLRSAWLLLGTVATLVLWLKRGKMIRLFKREKVTADPAAATEYASEDDPYRMGAIARQSALTIAGVTKHG